MTYDTETSATQLGQIVEVDHEERCDHGDTRYGRTIIAEIISLVYSPHLDEKVMGARMNLESS